MDGPAAGTQTAGERSEPWDAFISYRRADGRSAAAWLRRRLQAYRMPAALRSYARPLRIYQDTAYERATVDFYKDNIRPALDRSRHLIVVCTRQAYAPLPDGRQNWLQREVTDFVAAGPERRIVPVLVDGKMGDPLPAELHTRFPNLEVIDLRNLRGARRAMFWAWPRLDDELVKIIGALHDVPLDLMPDLRREDARRRQRRATIVAAGGLLFAAVLLLIAVAALLARSDAQRQLVRNLVAHGRLLYALSPSSARTYFARAVDVADRKTVPWTAADDSIARLWLGAPSLEHGPIFLRHQQTVRDAEWSADGTRVATASDDGTAQVWDAATGQPVSPPLVHAKGVQRVAFDPAGDRVITASWDGTARIWNAATGAPVSPPLQHGNGVNSAFFDPSGARVVTAGWDDHARLWDAATGKPLASPDSMPTKYWASWAEFDPKGRLIVTADAGGTARLWDARTAQPIGDEGFAHRDHVTRARFSPNGRFLVTASDDNTARVWDVLGARAVGEALQHRRQVRAACFSHDGSRVATASADNTARVWDAATGAPIGAPMQHAGEVNDVSFGADDRWVVTASNDGTARIWNASTGDPVGRVYDHPGAVMTASFDGAARRVLTASEDGTARIWPVSVNGPLLDEIVDGDHPQSPVNSVDFSRDGRWLAAGNNHGHVDVRAVDGGTPARVPIGLDGTVNFVAFSPGSERLLIATDAGPIWIWRTGPWDKEERKLEVSGTWAQSLAWSPDGTALAAGLRDGRVQVWSVADGHPRWPPFQHVRPSPAGQDSGDHAIQAVAFSPDGSRLASAGDDGIALLWDLRRGVRLGEPMRHGAALKTLAFAPGGKSLVTGGVDGWARLWDASTGRSLSLAARGGGSVNHVAFSPDGTRLATASDDYTARLFDGRTAAPVGTPLRHRHAVWWCDFSSDGKRLVTASQDDTAVVWDVQTGDPIGPPLRHDATITQAVFNRVGSRVVTAGFDGRARIWSVEPDPAPSSDLIPRIERETGLRYDDTLGGLRSLAKGEWDALHP
jgi:WD40 repeat protein